MPVCPRLKYGHLQTRSSDGKAVAMSVGAAAGVPLAAAGAAALAAVVATAGAAGGGK